MMRAYLLPLVLGLALLCTHASAQALTQVLNFTVPSVGQPAGSVAGPVGVTVDGSTVHLANFGDNSWHAYNMQRPAASALLSATTPNSARARQVIAVGTMVYVVCAGLSPTYNEIVAYDFTNPTAPVRGVRLQIPGAVVPVAASNSVVCAVEPNATSANTAALKVFDRNLALLSTVPASPSSTSLATHVVVNGSAAYVHRTGTTDEVDIYNLSAPATPVLQRTMPGSISHVKGTLACGFIGSTLLVYDVSAPLAPVLRGSILTNLPATGSKSLAISDNVIYATRVYAGFQPIYAFDASASTPVPVATVMPTTSSNSQGNQQIAAAGNLLYFVDGGALQVFSLSGVVSATQQAVDTALALYPNPTRTTLSVRGAVPNAPIAIYDLSGRRWLTTSLPAQESLDIGFLPAGFYLVRVGNAVRRLNVQ